MGEDTHERSITCRCDPGRLHGLSIGAGGSLGRCAAHRQMGALEMGATDRAGSANHTKNPDNIKRALATVKQFKSITVGKYYHRDIPSVGERKWSMVLPGTPHAG